MNPRLKSQLFQGNLNYPWVISYRVQKKNDGSVTPTEASENLSLAAQFIGSAPSHLGSPFDPSRLALLRMKKHLAMSQNPGTQMVPKWYPK